MNEEGEVYYSSVTPDKDRKRLIKELAAADERRSEELVDQIEKALEKLKNVEKE